MPYDTHGGGHRGELHLYCQRTKVKFSEMTSRGQRHESSGKISLLSEDNIRVQCQCAPLVLYPEANGSRHCALAIHLVCSPPCVFRGYSDLTPTKDD